MEAVTETYFVVLVAAFLIWAIVVLGRLVSVPASTTPRFALGSLGAIIIWPISILVYLALAVWRDEW